jgi:hypothetical protein
MAQYYSFRWQIIAFIDKYGKMATNMPQRIFEHRILELTQPNAVCDLDRKPGFFNSDQCSAPHATAQADLISSGCFHDRFDLLKSDLLYFIKRQANSLYQRFQTVSAFLILTLSFDGYRKHNTTPSYPVPFFSP